MNKCAMISSKQKITQGIGINYFWMKTLDSSKEICNQMEKQSNRFSLQKRFNIRSWKFQTHHSQTCGE